MKLVFASMVTAVFVTAMVLISNYVDGELVINALWIAIYSGFFILIFTLVFFGSMLMKRYGRFKDRN